MGEKAVESPAEILLDLNEKIRVLLVDDESSLLRIAKQCLEMTNRLQVDTALSVDEAWAKLEKNRYDAIVSDYQMPGKDGLEFLKKLREKGNTIPFIVFTGKGREDVAIRALNLGASQYLNKTGETETVYTELTHSITELARIRKAEDEVRASEEKFRNLFENANDGLVFADLSGRIVDINQKATGIAGKTKEEVVGKPLVDLELVSSKGVSFLEEMQRQQTMEKPTKKFEFEIKRENGAKRFVEINFTLIRKGNVPTGSLVIVRDTTERKRTKKIMNRLGTAVESTVNGIAVADLNGFIQFANPAWAQMHGYAATELIGKHLSIFHTEEQMKNVVLPFNEKVIQTGSNQGEVDHVKKDGTVFPTIMTTSLIRDENGNPSGFVGTAEDITERKTAEKALRESELRYRSLIEQSHQGILVAQGPAPHAVFVNKALADMLGYAAQDFACPEKVATMVPADDRSLFFKFFRGRLEGKEIPSSYECRAIRKDGSIVWLEVSSGLINYNAQPSVQLVFSDISKRKKLEKEALENRQRFEGLFIGNPEAAAYLGPNFCILRINPRFEKLFGYSLEEIKGKHINDVVVQKNATEEAEALDNKALEGYVYHNTTRLRKDGSLIPVAVSAAPITFEGKLTGIVAMYKDISDLRDVWKRLETMNEKLRVVGGLTRHDARNKLSIITGNAYLAKKKLAGNDKILEYLKEMETSVQQVLKIFNFAADYEKLGALELTYIDVGKTMAEAVLLFPHLKPIKIVNRCHGLTVLADSLLRQLFYNFIDNSLKYGEKTSQIKIHYEKAEDDRLRLIYEDDGVGISPANKLRLFKEGYSTGGSTGYGLYLIKKMMEVYGWTIQETGEPGKGAQFTITIPRLSQSSRENYRITNI
jgi:PAS domain S-box-containing protein